MNARRSFDSENSGDYTHHLHSPLISPLGKVRAPPLPCPLPFEGDGVASGGIGGGVDDDGVVVFSEVRVGE